MLTAIFLTLWSVVAIFDTLGPSLLQASRPLIAGTVAGIIVGEVELGMAIGGTLELAALGVYTYGGATIPDYQTGAIIGTVLGAAGAGDVGAQVSTGIAVGLPAAVLLASLDPIGRFLPTFWIHRADHYAAIGDMRAFNITHWTAFIPWALVRAIPTFLAALALNTATVRDVQGAIPQGFIDGMTLLGGILPAIGFAMLLKIMPVRRYWYMLLIGYVLFAYLEVDLLGIALFGLAIAIMFITLKQGPAAAEREVATGG